MPDAHDSHAVMAEEIVNLRKENAEAKDELKVGAKIHADKCDSHMDCVTEIMQLKQAVRLAHSIINYKFARSDGSVSWDEYIESGFDFMKNETVKRVMQEGGGK